MESVISRGEDTTLPEIMKGIQNLALEQNRKLIDLSYRVLAYERERIVLGEPTAGDKGKYLEGLKYLLDAIESILKLVSTADDRIVNCSELEWLAKRLRMSLDSFESSLTVEEAD